MARRYTRDNRGRFASVGATARGGRLRTEAGNKRATVTGRMEGVQPKGTISKPKGLKPDRNAKVKAETNQRLRARAAARKEAAAAAAKPVGASTSGGRQLVRGNFRPQNLYSATDRTAGKGYGTDAKANVAEARRRIEATGARSALKSNKRSSSVASVNDKTPNTVDVNASHTAWRNPRADMIKSRRRNEFSTSSANHYVAHELGHVRNPVKAPNWTVQNLKKGSITDPGPDLASQRIARRVSRYAMKNPAEFAAETSAGRSLGKRYDSQVMRQFAEITGRKPRNLRSQLNRKRK